MNNAYFGHIQNGWADFCAQHRFTIPYFEKEVEVLLGAAFDEDGYDVETPPSAEQIQAFAQTFKSFLADINRFIPAIQEAAFACYQDRYAKHYEKPFDVLFENGKVQKKPGELRQGQKANVHQALLGETSGQLRFLG